MRREVCDDGRGELGLSLAERKSVLEHLIEHLLGRPAQQRVRVEIAHHHADDVVAHLCVSIRVCLLDVLGAGGERCHGYVVCLERLLGAHEEVPFERNGCGQLVLGGGDGEDFLGGRSHGSSVEEYLQAI